jgi:cyclophilin family peptidyl-prolyl cis-trans isomerase
MRKMIAVTLLLSLAQLGSAEDAVPAHAQVAFETTEGNIVLELDGRRAPITVKNFLKLVDSGYYNGTVFHRVIPGFMIQGGGFDRDLDEKEPDGMIFNESGNGLTNLSGTIVMARLGEPHTAMAQFFINVVDNRSLDPKPDRWGFAVFGYVIEGMDVVEKISNVRTAPAGRFSQDVPVVPVIIKKAARVEY